MRRMRLFLFSAILILSTVSARASLFDPPPEMLFMQERGLLETFLMVANGPLIKSAFPDASHEKIAVELGKLNRIYVFIDEIYQELPDSDPKGRELRHLLIAPLKEMQELEKLSKPLLEKNETPHLSTLRSKVKNAAIEVGSALQSMSRVFPNSLRVRINSDRTRGLLEQVANHYYTEEKPTQCYEMGAILADEMISPSGSPRMLPVAFKIEQYCSNSSYSKMAFYELYEAMNRVYNAQQTGIKGSINAILDDITTTSTSNIISPNFKILPKPDQCNDMDAFRSNYRQLSTRMFIDVRTSSRINDQVLKIHKAVKIANAYCEGSSDTLTVVDVQRAVKSAIDAAKVSLRRIEID